jgi:hypothetical protein
MTIQEQIKALEETRRRKMTEMQKITKAMSDENRSMETEEAEQFDELDAAVKSLDEDITRLKRMEQLMLENADEVDGVEKRHRATKSEQRQREDNGSRGTGLTIITHAKEADEKFQGQNFTRMCIAMAAAHIKNHAFTAAQYAEHRWGKSAANIVAILKAGVPGGGSSSGQWGEELAAIDNRYRGDFIEYLYSQTVYDKLPLRPVPDNVLIKGQDGAGTGYWVGEKKAIPATSLDFLDVELRSHKAAALAAISNELIMRADPAAEQLVRDGLVNASSQRVDTTFLSTAAAVSGVSPAGILNGVTPISASGEDAQSLFNDIGALYAPFITAKNASGLYFVAYTGLAKSISLMRNALSQREFPDLKATGGMLEGDPVVTGENVPTAALILLKPSDIYRIGDTGFEVSVSKEATIEMDNAPTGDGHTPAAQSANMVSMFQNEMTAFKVVRHISFAKRRASAVQYINNATYNGSAT